MPSRKWGPRAILTKGITSLTGMFVVLGWMYAAIPNTSCFGQCAETGSRGSISASASAATGEDRIDLIVEVSDKSGHAISGLEASEFKVLDNNHEEKILDFRAIDAAHPPVVPPKVQIVIDAVNADAVMVAQERDGVSAFLKQNSGELEYPTSIWMLENEGLARIAGPSQDGAAMLAALNKAPSLLRVLNRSAGLWGAVERTGQAMKMRELVSAESRTPGRKLALFVSPGWPMLFNYEPDQRKWVFDEIVSISNGLRESCISLSSVIPVFETGNYDSFLKGVTKIADAQYADLSLQVLSEHSGGQVLVGGNDIKGEINTALRSASDYYILSFERAAGSRGNEYHNVRVTVDKPRVKVHTTAGYYLVGP